MHIPDLVSQRRALARDVPGIADLPAQLAEMCSNSPASSCGGGKGVTTDCCIAVPLPSLGCNLPLILGSIGQRGLARHLRPASLGLDVSFVGDLGQDVTEIFGALILFTHCHSLQIRASSRMSLEFELMPN